MSNSQAKIEQIINELTALQVKWNLKLNKKKSEILTGEQIGEPDSIQCINGILCTKTVKYLGVKVAIEKKD